MCVANVGGLQLTQFIRTGIDPFSVANAIAYYSFVSKLTLSQLKRSTVFKTLSNLHLAICLAVNGIQII